MSITTRSGRYAQLDHGRWRSLYRAGAVAALLSVIIIPLSIVAFFIWPLWPENILLVIQEDWLAGLMGLDSMYLFSNVLVIPFLLVLYVTHKEADDGWALFAPTLGLFRLGRGRTDERGKRDDS